MANSLLFDERLAPQIRRAIKFHEDFDKKTTFGEDPDGLLDSMLGMCVQHVWECAVNAHRFDCKQLDEAFLIETGEDRLNELKNGQEVNVALPHSPALFEFQSLVVVATQFCGGGFDPDDDDREVEYGKPGYEAQSATTAMYSATLNDPDVRHFGGGAYFVPTNKEYMEQDDNHEDDDGVSLARRAKATRLLFGVLTLMEERLLSSVIRTGASDRENRRRISNGKTTLRPYHVLTLNLAETSRRTSSVALHPHESTRLHWRRGHWRTLGRLSEFERRVWVRRCLVGDPSKGFAAKHYALKWQPTIH